MGDRRQPADRQRREGDGRREVAVAQPHPRPAPRRAGGGNGVRAPTPLEKEGSERSRPKGRRQVHDIQWASSFNLGVSLETCGFPPESRPHGRCSHDLGNTRNRRR